jgi:hypothetical protein
MEWTGIKKSEEGKKEWTGIKKKSEEEEKGVDRDKKE